MKVLTSAAVARSGMLAELERADPEAFASRFELSPNEKAYYLLRALGLPTTIAERIAEPLVHDGPLAFMREINLHVPRSSPSGNPPRFQPWLSAHDADLAGISLLAATAGVAHPEARVVQDGVGRATAVDPNGNGYDDVTTPSPMEIFDWLCADVPTRVLDPDRELARLGDAIEGMIGPR